MVVKIGGIRKYLWRAVDQDGYVLDVLIQSRRNAKAVKRFFGKLMRKKARAPRALACDTLASYVVAHREFMQSVEHRRSKYLNNRAENSHQPTRQQERASKFFRSPVAAQRFLAVFSAVSPHFRPGRHKLACAVRAFPPSASSIAAAATSSRLCAGAVAVAVAGQLSVWGGKHLTSASVWTRSRCAGRLPSAASPCERESSRHDPNMAH